MKELFKKHIVKIVIVLLIILTFIATSLPSCSNYLLNVPITGVTYINKNTFEPEITPIDERMEEEVETVNINTDFGLITIKKNPVRVITLFNEATETLVSLGYSPMAYLNSINDNSSTDWIDMMLKYDMNYNSVEIKEFDLETIAALQPDLILGSYQIHGNYYEELQKIAPTIFSQTADTSYNKNYLLFADAIGMKDIAQEKLIDYYIKSREISDKYGISERDFATIINLTEEESFLVLDHNFTAEVLNDLNYSFYNILADNEFLTPIELSTVNGDVIYVSVTPDKGSQKIFEDWIVDLEAKNDYTRYIYRVPAHIWNITNGYLSALEILQSIEYALSDFNEDYKTDTIELYKIN